ncbi:MAG TPA: hypothetical protein DEB10_08200 [Ruminococcaceae bacterium]|nr:hypothetical protein [Clostridiales bacterium]HBT64623.1 hypothetical protein [Oscillospiraceae bacterium]
MENLYKSVFYQSPYSQMIFDEHNRIVAANAATYKLFNPADSSIEGLYFGNALNCIFTKNGKTICGTNKICKSCQMQKLLLQKINTSNEAVTLEFKYWLNGALSSKWLDVYSNPIVICQRQCVAITLFDVSKYKEKHLQLEDRLSLDLATGALNKTCLISRIDEIVKFQSCDTVTACMIDFDDFKSINDTYGHLMGDLALKAFSSVVQREICKKDFLGRYGGEEFIIVFVDTELMLAIKLLQRIDTQFKVYLSQKIDEPTTLSCGVTSFRKGNSSFSNGTALIEHIDKLLYRAKQNGKNRIVSDNDVFYFS